MITLRNTKILLIILLLLSLSINAQKVNKKVVSFGNEIITQEEFRFRFELTPRLGDSSFDIDSLKKEFLASLLAEKLWAKEAEGLGFDTLEVIKFALKPIEKLFIKDALYKIEISDKIKLKNEEIIRATARKSITLKVLILNSVDSVEIFSLHTSLLKGAKFDSLLYVRPESVSQHQPVEIKFGQLVEQYVENTLYNLKPGNFSTPQKTENGWFIFYLTDKIKSTDDDKTKVEDVLTERKARIIGTKYLRNFFKGVTIYTDRELFTLLLKNVQSEIKRKSRIKEIEQSGDICLDESDITKFVALFGKEKLDLPFVKLNDSPVSFREFIYTLSFDGLCVKDTSDEAISYRLDQNVRKFIQTELLVREGIKRGLRNSPDVKNNMEMWRTNYTSQLLRNRYVDSVFISEEEYDTEIRNKSGNRILINLALLETDNLELIDKTLNDIQKGKSLSSIASEKSNNIIIRNNNGFTGFVSPESLGEIGKIALTLENGQVYGPIKTKEGYSLFELINKLEENDSTLRTAPINI
ncbi:MAG: peptidylprolyl isomerase, partial [Ignavibacteriaceae bacterium]|nr:peptidylprolyl isomerase [Ignavibacteriaceae bacterium]